MVVVGRYNRSYVFRVLRSLLFWLAHNGKRVGYFLLWSVLAFVLKWWKIVLKILLFRVLWECGNGYGWIYVQWLFLGIEIKLSSGCYTWKDFNFLFQNLLKNGWLKRSIISLCFYVIMLFFHLLFHLFSIAYL